MCLEGLAHIGVPREAAVDKQIDQQNTDKRSVLPISWENASAKKGAVEGGRTDHPAIDDCGDKHISRPGPDPPKTASYYERIDGGYRKQQDE